MGIKYIAIARKFGQDSCPHIFPDGSIRVAKECLYNSEKSAIKACERSIANHPVVFQVDTLTQSRTYIWGDY